MIFPANETSIYGIYGWDLPWRTVSHNQRVHRYTPLWRHVSSQMKPPMSMAVDQPGQGVAGCQPISVYNISVKVKRFPHLGMVVFEHKSYLPFHNQKEKKLTRKQCEIGSAHRNLVLVDAKLPTSGHRGSQI